MKSLIEHLRTLLILGRVSNLPTVWSNLLAGWMLADFTPLLGVMPPKGYAPDDTLWPTLCLLVGGSCLYVGGMYLNDFCDAVFDARFCPTRPIPAGKISRRLVGLLTILWFSAGFGCFTTFGPVTLGFTLLLISAIVLYDFHHKDVAWAPLLMGFCRCLLYLLAACSMRECYFFSTVYGDWLDGALTSLRIQSYLRNDSWDLLMDVFRLALPAAIPLGLYVAGITYYARGESRPTKPTRWALILVLMPVLVQIVLHLVFASQFQVSHFIHPYEHMRDPQMLISWWFWQSWWVPYSLVFLAWTAWLLIPLWRGTKPSIGRVVAGMLAGIVLVDMMALTGAPDGFPPTRLVIYFLLALLLQRIIPAT